MKIKYTGDNDEIELYGIVFPNGEGVDVPDDLVAGRLKRRKITIMAVDKLKNHREFEVVSEEPEITRKQIMDQLTEMNIVFKQTDKKDTLLGLLNGNHDGA